MTTKKLSDFTNKSQIKIVIFDFDGVFTDNTVVIDENGLEYVVCCRYDGYGIQALKEKGIHAVVVTSESKPLAAHRCMKLGIECYLGNKDKLKQAEILCKELGLSMSEVCFMGNDINDIELLERVGFPVRTPDCHMSLRGREFYTTSYSGGRGCVRELADFLTL